MQLSAADPAAALVNRVNAITTEVARTDGQLEQLEGSSSRPTNGRGWGRVLDSTSTALQHTTQALLALSAPDGPPSTPPSVPTTPPTDGSAAQRDAKAAAALVQQSIDTIRTVPASDRGDESTKEARISAFRVNKEAQALLEPYFGSAGTPPHDAGDPAVLSALRTADASLEDAGWQLARKPSPDGRFSGVDIPGAMRDSQAALDALVRVAG